MYIDCQECPICGQGNLERKVVEETFQYKGHTPVVPDYVIFRCSVCEESLVDRKSAKNSQGFLKEFFHRLDQTKDQAEEHLKIRIRVFHSVERICHV